MLRRGHEYKAARLYDYLNGRKRYQILNQNSGTSTQMAPKEGVKPILFDFDDEDDEPSTANAGDNINEDSKGNEKKINIFD